MKKAIIVLLFLSVVAGTALSALETTTGIAALKRTEQGDSEGISLFWAVFLNVLPGFGVGSFCQGNQLAGSLQLVVQGVPFAYGGYRAFEIMRDWHPALYVFWPFIVPFCMLVDVWPLFTYGAGITYGIIAAVRTDRGSGRDRAENQGLGFATGPSGFMFSYRY